MPPLLPERILQFGSGMLLRARLGQGRPGGCRAEHAGGDRATTIGSISRPLSDAPFPARLTDALHARFTRTNQAEKFKIRVAPLLNGRKPGPALAKAAAANEAFTCR